MKLSKIISSSNPLNNGGDMYHDFDEGDKAVIRLAIAIAAITLLIFLFMTAVGRCAGHAPADQWNDELDLSSLTGEVEIAHWNIRVLSNRSRDDTELNHIADIIEKYDFVAISELRDVQVLARLQAILRERGFDYKAQVSPKVGKADSRHKELYAFLYDSDFTVQRAGMLIDDTDDRFVRDPYWASFKVDNFDFSIIVSHIVWGRRVAGRRAEIQALKDVYAAVQRQNGTEQDVLLVGDFNRNPSDRRAWAPLLSLPTMQMLFQLPMKSHIKDSSLYDNILFQSKFLSEYTGEAGIDRFDETEFNNRDAAANRAVSDHRPVWARFRTNGADDD